MSFLALVLHAHLPFVRHPEHEEFFEEDWLFEAISETYIPLIAMMQRLVHDGVPLQAHSQHHAAALRDAGGRTASHALSAAISKRTIRLAEREIERTREEPELQELAEFYRDTFAEIRRQYEEWNCDLLAEFRQLRDAACSRLSLPRQRTVCCRCSRLRARQCARKS